MSTKDIKAMLGLPAKIDGSLHLDADTRCAFSRDVGGIIKRIPAAVFRPRSAEGVAQAVAYCAAHKIQALARGQGHTVFGQSLLDGGLLIDTRPLGQIHCVDQTSAEVGPGVLWTELLSSGLRRGLTPTLTGYTDLSVGGTLSVGGVSSSLTDLQIGQVLQLQVVTGVGDIVDCSAHENRDLFEVVLGGLGRFGIITRAKVSLHPAPAWVRTYRLEYADSSLFFSDLRLMLAQMWPDSIYATWRFDNFGLVYELIISKKIYDLDAGESVLLAGTSVDPSSVTDKSYVTWATETTVSVSAMQRDKGWNERAKPWLDVWLPNSRLEDFLCTVLDGLTREDIGTEGFILLIPQQRSKINNPFFRIPENDGSDWIFLFDLLTVSATPDLHGAFTRRMLERNENLLHLAREYGATLYPIGASQMNRQHRAAHYAHTLPELERRKKIFDPHGIFTPL